MDRMPALDRNILRVAIYEVLYEPELADQIAINEAVEIAEDISTVDSSAYINGVLGRISALKESLI
jgi:N utilization substance protein B